MDERTPEELRKLWVEALRSGKYKQGTGTLRRGNEFCCLGVACDILNPGGWDEVTGFAHETEFGFNVWPPSAGNKFIPVDTMAEFDEVTESLYKMNDGGKSFGEIADFIERKYGVKTDA